jgi:hypothetical protein
MDKLCSISDPPHAADGDVDNFDEEIGLLCLSPAIVPARRYVSDGLIIDVIDAD